MIATTEVQNPEWLHERHKREYLPQELRHPKIRTVRNASTYGKDAYQIVFDQEWLPYSYWNPKPEDWEITYARAEYHKPERLFSFLFPERPCITIVVTRDRDNPLFDDTEAE